MSAFVSLAFGLKGSLNDCPIIDAVLKEIGLHFCSKGNCVDGMQETYWSLDFYKTNFPIICRCYQQNGWVATNFDIQEELFDNLEQKQRKELVTQLVQIGIYLLQSLQLRYVFFDEEAEADIHPDYYCADLLFGITLVADNVPKLDQIYQRSDVKKIDKFQGGLVIFRRLDPVPHYVS